MVALGMLPKDEEFRQLKHKMETLEGKNDYPISMISWMAQRLGSIFHPSTGTHAWMRPSTAANRSGEVGPSSAQDPHARY
jgi:hypothetical protein